jgi:hypothetical protein
VSVIVNNYESGINRTLESVSEIILFAWIEQKITLQRTLKLFTLYRVPTDKVSPELYRIGSPQTPEI